MHGLNLRFGARRNHRINLTCRIGGHLGPRVASLERNHRYQSGLSFANSFHEFDTRELILQLSDRFAVRCRHWARSQWIDFLGNSQDQRLHT